MPKATRALAALLAATALAGCSYAPSDAAVVGGVRITDAQVKAESEAVGEAIGRPASSLVPAITAVHAQAEVARLLAAKLGVAVTDAQRAEVAKRDQTVALLSKTPATKPVADAIAETMLVKGALDQAAWIEGCGTVPVALNPKYGQWSAQLCGPVDSISLSQPAPPKP